MTFHSNLKYGDKREDGYIYVGKRYGRKGNKPDWRSPEAFKRKVAYSKKNKKKTYDLISKLTGEEKIKHGCAHCGYKNEPVALDFHHTDRANKFLAVSSYWRTSMIQFKKIKKEWEKCIVLCANCHRLEEKRIRDANK
tara:strand:+ start:78 stop:491 length:414 start_codon:yes stop_codon:yes gene_type:complete